MTVVGLLEKLRALDVRLWAENGQLKISAPRGVLTPELTEELRRLKPELLQHLVDAAAVQQDEPLTASAATRNEAPFSLAQRRFWFFEQMQPGSSVLHIPVAFRISGGLDVPALERTLTAMVARHETLRTRIAETDDGAEQYVESPFAVSLVQIDLRTQADVEAEVERCQAEIAGPPFDFFVGPLWRAQLLRTRDDEWLLLLVIHHLVADGWSLGVLLHELGRTYSAIAAAQTPAAPLPVQYRDFAAWQAKRLDQPAAARQLEWWTRQLAQPLPVLDLPLDRVRPPVQTYNGRTFRGAIPAALTQRIAATARKDGATLFMALLTVFNVLLSRWSGQRDVIVGVPVAGRVRAELEPLIGVFINTLAIRTDVDRELNFVDLLRRVRDTTLDALANQEVPFERIVQELNLPRDLSRSPVFQVLFNMFDRSGPSKLPFGDGTIELVADDAHADAKFDLTFYAFAGDAGVDCTLVYNADLFSAERITALFDAYVGLLPEVAAQPERAIAWTPSAAVPAAVGAAAAELAPASSDSVLERLKRHASATPQRVFARDETGTIAFGELDRRSTQVARWLAERGVKPGATVGIVAHRSAGFVTALLGIWKAGAAFVVLDPAHPVRRLEKYVEIAAPSGLIVVAEAMADASFLVGDDAFTLTLPESGWPEELAALPAEDIGIRVDPDDLAYVAFTSGSTGEPKGIRGSHRPLTHFLDWYTHRFALSETAVVSLLSGLAHDPVLRDVLTPLWLGGRLEIPSPDALLDPALLASWMTDAGVSVAHITPSLAGMLVDAVADGAGASLGEVRLVCFGGEALGRELIVRVAAAAPQATLVNGYGATETPQLAAYHVIEPASDSRRPSMPLGRGITGTELLVLTEQDLLAGVGELGEIAVRSPFLALGYVDAAETGRRFTPNPITGAAADRIYRTGDLGRYLPDGSVEHAGRRDLQVKVRGYRIELSEVESSLQQHESVRQAVASAYDDGSGDRRLAAYVVFEPGAKETQSELRKYLRRSLPEYMVPSLFLVLDAVPLTPNGKVDRAALPPPIAAPRRAAERVPPRTATEQIVARVWQEVLRRDDISVHDNFFDVGGHSLLTMQAIMRIEKETGVRLNPFRFMVDTLEQIGAAIEQLAAQRPVERAVGKS